MKRHDPNQTTAGNWIHNSWRFSWLICTMEMKLPPNSYVCSINSSKKGCGFAYEMQASLSNYFAQTGDRRKVDSNIIFATPYDESVCKQTDGISSLNGLIFLKSLILSRAYISALPPKVKQKMKNCLVVCTSYINTWTLGDILIYCVVFIFYVPEISSYGSIASLNDRLLKEGEQIHVGRCWPTFLLMVWK